MAKNILVIKLGALGDFVQALGPMASIRKHHENAHIILLTTPFFTKIAEESGYFDKIWAEKRPVFADIGGWIALWRKLNTENLDRVYDLQNNDRTNLYFKLFKRKNKPEWVGVAKGASHRNTSPERTTGLAFDGHVQTLALTDIRNIAIDNLGWMQRDIKKFTIKEPYAILVPGSSPNRPEKRWEAEKYAELAKILANRNIQAVILGTASEADLAAKITETEPNALDLTGQTDLMDIPALARGAKAAIGNDTGPMHLIGPTGCDTLVLFSEHSQPHRHRPLGANVQTLQNMSVSPQDVLTRLELYITHDDTT